jgi:hypothetical protein
LHGQADERPLVCLVEDVLEVAEAARAARRAPHPPRALDLLLDGLAVLITEGYAAGAPMLKRALSAFRGRELSAEEGSSGCGSHARSHPNPSHPNCGTTIRGMSWPPAR